MAAPGAADNPGQQRSSRFRAGNAIVVEHYVRTRTTRTALSGIGEISAPPPGPEARGTGESRHEDLDTSSWPSVPRTGAVITPSTNQNTSQQQPHPVWPPPQQRSSNSAGSTAPAAGDSSMRPTMSASPQQRSSSNGGIGSSTAPAAGGSSMHPTVAGSPQQRSSSSASRDTQEGLSGSAGLARNLRRYDTLRQQLSESQALEDSLRRELQQLTLRHQIQALAEVNLRQQIQLHQLQEELTLRQELQALQDEADLMQQQAQRLSEQLQRGNRPVAAVVPPARLAELPRATVAGPVEGAAAGRPEDAQGGAAAGAGGNRGDAAEHVCSVCQGEVCPGEVQVVLPCSHSFHEACITQWLGQYDSRCPNCMRDVR